MQRPKQFICRACDAVFEADGELQAHHARVHPKEPAKVATEPPDRDASD